MVHLNQDNNHNFQILLDLLGTSVGIETHSGNHFKSWDGGREANYNQKISFSITHKFSKV